jgi:ribonucleoside-diphosphate reductase alpha chain
MSGISDVRYQKEEVIEKATEYFGGNDLAADVWSRKYALHDENGDFCELTPQDTHVRLAKEFARIERKYPNPMSEEEILGLIEGFGYVIPQGSPMFGVGNPFQLVSVSNCFVIDTKDSYGGILNSDERIAQISKRRGGVGLDISPLRPKGMSTKNAAKTTDGIKLFMERFSNTTREVGQQGRRGALMLSISVHHPEVISFIKAKHDKKHVTGANISVRITDEFMKAVRDGKKYEQRWPVDSENPEIKEKVDAKEVWDVLTWHAHADAEPGLLFWDNVIKNSPADIYSHLGFKTTSTNPCGELPLCPLDSCRLMLNNLAMYVIDPFTEKARFDWALFKTNVQKAQRLMDDLVDIEAESVSQIIAKIKSDPEPDEIKANELALWEGILEKCINGRRTGLGITALGDCIAMQNIAYGSDEGLAFVDKVYQTLRNEAYKSSVIMAKERGAFEGFDASLEKGHPFLKKLPLAIRKDMKLYGRRNMALLTTPPAGSTSIVAALSKAFKIFGSSSGFEPIYLAQHFRKVKQEAIDETEADFVDAMGDKWKSFEVNHAGLQLFMEITGKTFQESPYFGSQSGDLDFIRRVEMQATATSSVDHAISSTLNLPKDTTVEAVGDIYLKAWEMGCKGLTIYRDGCRDGVLTKGKECDECDEGSDAIRERPQNIVLTSAPKRTKVLECDIIRSKVGGGDWLFFVGRHQGRPYEIFGGESPEDLHIPQKYKTGWVVKDGVDADRTLYDLYLGDIDDDDERLSFHNIAKAFKNYQHAPFSRLISASLRHGVPINVICEQITKDPEDDLFSYARAISRVLKRYIKDGEVSGLECPECHSSEMIYKNGCPACMICGASSCS